MRTSLLSGPPRRDEQVGSSLPVPTKGTVRIAALPGSCLSSGWQAPQNRAAMGRDTYPGPVSPEPEPTAGHAVDLAALSSEQRDLLDAWMPGYVVEHDLSWGLIETTVLQVRHGGDRFVVKAGGPTDRHIKRELRAHREFLGPWTAIGRAPRLVHGDADAKLVVTGYLPGRLVENDPTRLDPDTYRKAGELLRLLHAQPGVIDDAYHPREATASLAWLDRPNRIDPPTKERLRAEIASWTSDPVLLVPTHGDWQPRNWLIHDGEVFIIDFGRADLRPAMTDFSRMAVKGFAHDKRLESAFLDGYGSDPREPVTWHRTRVREAIGTAAWAYGVGDEDFEALGHRMIADVLATSDYS